jgi:hypothetical protein
MPCQQHKAAVYLPYDALTPPPGDELERLFRYPEINNILIVIGCNANSHNVAWDSTDTNRRGAVLLEYIAYSNLEIVNRGSEPTFVTRVREQVIDIMLSSASIWQEIVNWRVSKELSLSDHRIIRFIMSADPKILHEYRNPLTGSVIKQN